MKDNLMEAVLEQQETAEYEAFRNVIGKNGGVFLHECFNLAGETCDVNPLAKLVVENNLMGTFTELLTAAVIRAFHYGWLAKTQESI